MNLGNKFNNIPVRHFHRKVPLLFPSLYFQDFGNVRNSEQRFHYQALTKFLFPCQDCCKYSEEPFLYRKTFRPFFSDI